MSTQTETTPDQLLESFRGRSFKSIILFTLIAHLVVIVGSSIPYFVKSVTGKTDSTLSEQERLDLAAREANSTLRDIAAKHGLKPQDLSARLSGDTPAAPAKEPTTTPPAPATDKPTTPTPEPATPTTEAEKPKSAIEEKIEVKKEGPTVPPVPSEEANDEDLFR
jgi:hypothetical protein